MRAPLLLLLAAATSCGGSSSSDAARSSAPGLAPAAAHAALGGGVVARAGTAAVPASLVGAVAGRRSIPAAAAVDALLADALLAQGATAQHLETRPDLAGELVAVRAQQTVRKLRERTVDIGPPTDAEVAELTALHWQQVDVPESLEVVHAVALRPASAPKPDPAGEARARAVAAAIEQAVVPATTKEDFEARAKAVPHDGVEVKVEALPPFAEDGRLTTQDGALDEAFSRGAFAVHGGVTSPVVESSFGWHVIRVLNRVPAKHASLGERRRIFVEEVNARRGRQGMDALIATLRSRAQVQISPAVESILRDAKLP